jgi:hypothetical protein
MIGRIVVIILAFLTATVAAGATIAAALLGPEWPVFSGTIEERAGFWVLAFFAASASGAMVVLPLFLLVVLAESFSLRSVLLYAVGGAAVMVFGYFPSGFTEHDAASAPFPVGHEVTIAAAGGIVFGFVYWLIAGRKAGAWRGKR